MSKMSIYYPFAKISINFYQDNFERQKKIVLRLKISFFRRELVACFRKGTIWIEWTSGQMGKLQLCLFFSFLVVILQNW